eukprot:7503745-Pyramimonas_sp.AAC.1
MLRIVFTGVCWPPAAVGRCDGVPRQAVRAGRVHRAEGRAHRGRPEDHRGGAMRAEGDGGGGEGRVRRRRHPRGESPDQLLE